MKKQRANSKQLISNSNDFKTSLKECDKFISTSQDMGRVMVSFSNLMEDFLKQPPLRSNENEVHEQLHKMFKSIEARIKWPKDAAKIQNRLTFYKSMAYVYEKCGNPKEGVECFKILMTRFFDAITKKNVKQHIEIAYTYFKEGQTMTDKHNIQGYHSVYIMVLNRFEAANLPKICNIYLDVMNRWGGHLTDIHKYEEAVDIRLQKMDLFKTIYPPYDQQMISCMYALTVNYHFLEKWKEAQETCELMFNVLKTGDPDFEKDDVKLEYYCNTLYRYAIILQGQSSPHTKKAFNAFLNYIHNNYYAKKLLQRKPDYHALISNANDVIQGHVFSPEKVQEIEGMMRDMKYNEAVEILEPYFAVDRKKDVDLMLPILLMYANCLCCIGNHNVPNIEMVTDIIDNVEKYNLPMRTKLSELVAQCQLHRSLWNEARDNLLGLWKNSKFTDHKWVLILADLLIYTHKFKKAIRVLKKDDREKNDCKIRMAYFFMRNYKKAFKNLDFEDDEDEEETKRKCFEFLSGTRKPPKTRDYMDFLKGCALRRMDRPCRATEIMTLHNKQLGISWPTQLLAASERCHGEKNKVIKELEKAMDQLDTNTKQFDRLTFETMFTFDRADPKKYIKTIQNDLKNPKGSRILKAKKGKLEHYCNSFGISTFFQKKLKRDIHEQFLLNSPEMLTVSNTSYAGYNLKNPIFEARCPV